MSSNPSHALAFSGQRLAGAVAAGPTRGWKPLQEAFDAAEEAVVGMLDADGGGELADLGSVDDVIESIEGTYADVDPDDESSDIRDSSS